MEIEMHDSTTATERRRDIERDARAWSKFSGMKYTEALRLMEHPLAQGILGARICARDVIRVLTEHPVLSEPIWDTDDEGKDVLTGERVTHLGDNGLWAAERSGLRVSTEDDYLSVVLTAEVLRMFTATAQPQQDAYSYSLKHTAEELLGEHLGELSYIANGQAIWAAAVLGFPMAESLPGEYGPNADFGLVAEQVEYARQLRRSNGPSTIRAHHHRPPGYTFFVQALQRYRDTGEIPARWNGIDENAEPTTSPFHDWLVAQAGPSGVSGAPGSRGRLAGYYRSGVQDGDHGIARVPEELMVILHDVGASPDFLGAGRKAIVEWARTSLLSTGIRTEFIDGDQTEHEGWGAGSGDIERYEYICPCGDGRIIEEHDNVPGFREHDVRIVCSTCAAEWAFAPGLPVHDWRLVPIDKSSSP